ncbi:sensor histidine kinase [Methylobacterium brachythecii]|uniref:histidine kinase n=1 Tax=Methylobacterium brachythecii TaxID=1176177 RepID=A0A7W6AKN7_9HYPH|nr:GAF domain-containing protein [Methylobacterium brachythecii]MBB3905217.1 two-component sensor histidine kinase [Methylobacterium brachythecii]
MAELEAFDVLDTGPEEGFEDVVQIARQICDAPVALVSLVASDRQWFKARAGFPDCQTDLTRSVCVYALSEPDLLIIPDLSADPRTRGNPLVTDEPHIRFYAGAPLRTDSGRTIGSLCVIDHKPRPAGLDEGQADALRRLARQVMLLLRERGQLAKMQASDLLAAAAASRRAALLELGDHLRDASTVADMTARAAEIVGRVLNGSRAGYGELDQTGEFLTIAEEWVTAGTSRLAGNHRLADYGTIVPVIQSGETLVVRAASEDDRTAGHSAAFAKLDVSAMLNVPVRERGRTVGLLYVHTPEARAWAPEEIGFARNVADRVQVAIGRLRAEEQQSILNHELSHRMKNVLAMVQAIAAQTIRNASDLDAAGDALSARLVAMGKAHDILLGGEHATASLDAVIRGALSIHDDAQVGRLKLDGPLVPVGSKAALSLALMIHELATNAGKYGALSTPDGHVTVKWEVTSDQDRLVRICWIEKDGPLVAPPSRRGFGTRLIERGLAGLIGGEVQLTYPPEGVICELTAPLTEFQANT